MSAFRPALQWQSRAVMARHVLVHLRHWYTAALPPICEPLILLLAFGIGLGSQMSGVLWRGQEISYLTYLAPGILAYTAFMTAFFQSLFGAFIRMHYQRVWEGQLCSQVRLEHVVWGEVLWASALACAYCLLVMLVLLVFHGFGQLDWQWWWLPATLPFLFVTSLAFACFGLLFTAIVPNIDHMNLPFFLVIMPIAFTSSTYFPLHSEWLAVQVWQGINPLHHLAEGLRCWLLQGQLSSHLLWGPLLCLIMVALLLPRIIRILRKRVLGEY
ncbi:MAG: hypothetical protein EA402_11330 [Planctomycetota bacterium]|nr:MAG: hypothetical protein EA402_11330 [Planctomycetota bacterium]